MKKKKIVHVVEAFGGGVFTFLVDLINETINDFDITIVYALRKQTPLNFEKYFDKNVKFIKSNFLKREINIKNDLKAMKEIKTILKNEKPDIVHLHSSKAGIIGRIAIKDKNVKLLYNPHGFSFFMQNISKMKKKIYWLIERIFAFKNCTIIGCSEGEYAAARGLSKNSILINNGININKLNKETEGLKYKDIDIKKIKICTVGRINYQKNPELFNKIASQNPDIEFTWIGEGDLNYKLTSKNINITGWRERKEVLDILNQNDIFLLPSLWEGLPIALLEAMYMKKICIVSNVVGNRDVINNGENGFVAKEGKDYSKILKELKLENIEKITKNAKEDVIKKYNIENVVNKYKKIYTMNI